MERRSFRMACVLGFVVACGGAADNQPTLQPLPPPPVPAAVAEVSTPAPAAETPAPKPPLADMQAAALKTMAADPSDAGKRAALYAPDATAWIPGTDKSEGRDAIQKAWEAFVSSNTGLKLGYVRTWTKGAQMAVEFVATATDKTTGKPWGVDGLSILAFNDDGLIATDRTYVDLLTIKKQTGAFKDKIPVRPIAALPTAPAQAFVAKGDAGEEKNVASEKGIVGAWAKLDVKAVLGFYAPTATLEDQSDDKTRSLADMKRMFTAFVKGRSDAKWTDQADFGVLDVTIDDGELTSTRPDKKTVTSHAAEIDQWKDGRIVKSWQWSNGLEVPKQLGTGPYAASARHPAAAPTGSDKKPAIPAPAPPSK